MVTSIVKKLKFHRTLKKTDNVGGHTEGRRDKIVLLPSKIKLAKIKAARQGGQTLIPHLETTKTRLQKHTHASSLSVYN